MAGAQKKVVVRLFDGAPITGYLPVSGFVEGDVVPLMDSGGRSIHLAISEIKLIAYVWDFNSGDPEDPERLGRKRYPARPRSEGLWLRMMFRDGDLLEGLAAADISLLEWLATDRGVMVTPPDARSNTQRVYVPRAALSGLEILGVIQPRRTPAPTRDPQPGLFG